MGNSDDKYDEQWEIARIQNSIERFVVIFILFPIIFLISYYMIFSIKLTLIIINESSRALTVTIKKGNNIERTFVLDPKSEIEFKNGISESYVYIVKVKPNNSKHSFFYQIDSSMYWEGITDMVLNRNRCLIVIPEEKYWRINGKEENEVKKKK